MSNPQHEPTMEEILASIRKIISEDQPDAAKAAPAPSPTAAPEPPPPPPPTPVQAAAPIEADVLELTDEVKDEQPAPAPVAKRAATTPEFKGMRVLVAEDNENNQLLIELLLKRQGVESVMVSDGKAAFRAVQTGVMKVREELETVVGDGLVLRAAFGAPLA